MSRVLLAEDGLDNQRLISTQLRRAGWQVEIAENGRIAIEAALKNLEAGTPFDLIFMDMQMPELDGYAATTKLRALGYVRPIVALTAHAMKGDREKCLGVGCDEYLSKPVTGAALIAMADRFTGRLTSDLGDDPDIAPLLDQFLSGLQEKRAAMARAFANADAATLARIAHQLKGCAGGYGYQAITDTAAVVERCVAEQLSREQTHRSLEALMHLIERACNPTVGRSAP